MVVCYAFMVVYIFAERVGFVDAISVCMWGS